MWQVVEESFVSATIQLRYKQKNVEKVENDDRAYQKFMLDGELLDLFNNLNGVPRGSTLSPILFRLLIDDMTC